MKIQTNSLVNSSAVYLLLVRLKEKIVFSQFYSFDDTKQSQINFIILYPSNIPGYSGTYRVSLYKVSSVCYYFDSLNTTAKGFDTINS